MAATEFNKAPMPCCLAFNSRQHHSQTLSSFDACATLHSKYGIVRGIAAAAHHFGLAGPQARAVVKLRMKVNLKARNQTYLTNRISAVYDEALLYYYWDREARGRLERHLASQEAIPEQLATTPVHCMYASMYTLESAAVTDIRSVLVGGHDRRVHGSQV